METWILAAGGGAPAGPPTEMDLSSGAIGLLAFYVLGALAVSFLCSILEAALLSVRVTELHERKAAGDAGAARLLDLKENRVDDAISAILTLNTIAHTIGATLAGAQFAAITGNRWLGIFSGVLTLLVLVITEIIPKTIGTVHASRLVSPVALILRLLMVLLTPILFLTRAITGMISHGGGETVTRGELAALVALASSEGAIEHREQTVVENILGFEQVRVVDVMTPRTVVMMLPADTPARNLVADPNSATYSRIPLYGTNRDDVRHYVLQIDVLRAAAKGESLDKPLSTWAREAWAIPDSATLASALHQFLERREPIALVLDEFGGFEGVCTLEDVIETVLGTEILDERDRVADLREVAKGMRERRVQRSVTQRKRRAAALAASTEVEKTESTKAPAEEAAASNDEPRAEADASGQQAAGGDAVSRPSEG